MSKTFTAEDVLDIAKLVSLNLSLHESDYFPEQFNKTLKNINVLSELDTNEVEETSQVTGLTNVFRADVIDNNRILSQKQALSGAKRSYKGYFVVKAILSL